ncbi:MAG: hypothetical protein WC322_03065 [Candidatus Paceibacterota bacterium]|jgi:hypothetical protein
MPVGESKMPQGGPTDKGLPVDPGIPGAATFAKPEDDIRKDRTDDEPIKRVDGPDDLTKDRDRIDTREDNADKHDGIGGLGKGEWDSGTKSKYPYRDGLPLTHSAATVVGMWVLQTAPTLTINLEDTRIAATLDQIVKGLSSKVVERSSKCKVTLKRADNKNLRWIFSVDSGNGPKLVRMKATRKGNVVTLTKMDVAFPCSCPAWQWLGPEHNAQQGKYLDGKPVGTAAPPVIRDPKRANKVCKHVAAVVGLVKGWSVGAKKGCADPFVLNAIWEVSLEPEPSETSGS